MVNNIQVFKSQTSLDVLTLQLSGVELIYHLSLICIMASLSVNLSLLLGQLLTTVKLSLSMKIIHSHSPRHRYKLSFSYKIYLALSMTLHQSLE